MKRLLIFIIAMIMAQASMAQQDKPAYVILQTMMQKYDVTFTQENLDGADWGSPEEEGLICRFGAEPVNYSLICFPHKKGGYLAVLFAEDMSTFELNSYTFYYEDGEITNPSDVLPFPTIDDYYSNAAQFPKDAHDEIANLIGYPIYNYEPSTKQLTATYLLLFSESDVIKKYMQARKAMTGPQIHYTWDGEQFVRIPTSKPFDEDLSIFGVEGYVVKNPENIAKEAIKAYFATDPFEIGLSQQEYWDKYGFDVIISSSTIAETMGIYLKEKEAARKLRIACYEFKKGGFLVICSESMTQKVEMFSFKDGKLTPLPNAFPQFDSDQIKSLSPSAIILESGYYIDHFTYDGLEIHRTNFDMDTETMSIINHGDTVTFFKWDGEKFIKQQ